MRKPKTKSNSPKMKQSKPTNLDFLTTINPPIADPKEQVRKVAPKTKPIPSVDGKNIAPTAESTATINTPTGQQTFIACVLPPVLGGLQDWRRQRRAAAGKGGMMIRLSVAGRIATLCLSRPQVNAINDEWVRLFSEILDDLAPRSDWNVLHLISDQRTFCAGADLAEVRAHIDAPGGPDRMYAYVAGIQRLYRRIEQLPQVTLAEISGAAMGGGLELALACDLRIAATDAKIGLPEARLGLIPGAGGTQRLTKLCGRSVASRLILGAEIIDGSVARELGVVQWAVPRAELRARALEIAERIAALPAPALAWSKACIAAAEGQHGDGYRDELEGTRLLLTDTETRQRVEAFFAGAQR